MLRSYWDSDGRYDGFLEAIDLRTNRVVGSHRFDFQPTNLIGPGLIGRVYITDNASVRFRGVPGGSGGGSSALAGRHAPAAGPKQTPAGPFEPAGVSIASRPCGNRRLSD